MATAEQPPHQPPPPPHSSPPSATSGTQVLIDQPHHFRTDEASLHARSTYRIRRPLREAPPDSRRGEWGRQRLADLVITALLIIGGGSLTAYAQPSAASMLWVVGGSVGTGPAAAAGALLFDAATIPLIIYVCSAAVGLGSRRADDIGRALACLTLAFVSLIVRRGSPSYPELCVLLLFAGFIRLAESLFYLAPEPEVLHMELIDKYTRALSMPGAGLALSYFYERVVPIAHALDEAFRTAEAQGARGSTIEMKTSRDQIERLRLLDGNGQGAKLDILVPRDLSDGDIDLHLSALGATSGVISTPLGGGSGGPNDVLLSCLPVASDATAADGATAVYAAVDVPVSIGACYEHRRQKQTIEQNIDQLRETLGGHKVASLTAGITHAHPSLWLRLVYGVEGCVRGALGCSKCIRNERSVRQVLDEATAGGDAQQLDSILGLELADFANSLRSLIERHPITRRHVRLWSVPPPPFEHATLTSLCTATTSDEDGPGPSPAATVRTASSAGFIMDIRTLQ